MEKKNKRLSVVSRYATFKKGVIGIGRLIDYEPNAWFDIAASLVVVIAGIEYNLSGMEWIAVVISIGLVFAAVALNLAIEIMVELPEVAKNPFSDLIAKLAATAVLVANLTAFIVGLIVFIPKIFWGYNY